MTQARRDTGPAKRPGLPKIQPQDAQLARWVQAVAEILEVQGGHRGNEMERSVTLRELKALQAETEETKEVVEAITEALGIPPGASASEVVGAFQDTIRELKLYKDLMKSLDDPSRFDDMRREVREVLLRSLSDEARERGADIRQVQTKLQSDNLSLAMRVDEVTAAAGRAASGVRELAFATAERDRAQAGKVTQIEASLGNYYQDGTPGRAKLEETMVATADRVDGLAGEYMLKIQAGKAVAGFGLAASEDPSGSTTSALIVSAEKFAIVNPDTYSGGLVNPSEANIPFGVDGNGIYMRSNVYLDGTMTIKGGSKKLVDGLRGSVDVSAGTGAWNATAARNKVWQTLGNSGPAPNNNHLVIGDTVTMGSGTSTTTRMWNGSTWIIPAVAINGNLLVDGTVSASKINTNGLTVRDQYGNAILGAGTKLDFQNTTGFGELAKIDKIRADNASTYIEGAAIRDLLVGSARIREANIDNLAVKTGHIDNLAVNRLKIAGESATILRTETRGAEVEPGVWINPPETSRVLMIATVEFVQARVLPGADTSQIFHTYLRLIPNGWGSPVAEINFRGSPMYTDAAGESVATVTMVGEATIGPGSRQIVVQPRVNIVSGSSPQWTSAYVRRSTVAALISMK